MPIRETGIVQDAFQSQNNRMKRVGEQSFSLGRAFVRLSHFGIWFFGAFAVLSVVLAILEPIHSPGKKGALVVYLLMALFFAGFAYAGFRVTRQFGRAPVSVDDDGIWSTSIGKSDGLVRWEDIAVIEERQYGQRLELLGKDGDSLVKLEYQLVGFEELRQIVLLKVSQPTFAIQCPATFKKSVGYHVFTISATAGFAGLAYYVGQMHSIFGAMAVATLVFLIGQDYLKTVAALAIGKRTLDIRYPLRRKTLDISEVSSIYLNDQFVKGNRIPEVIVECHSGENPFRLKQLGLDTSALYDFLIKWKEEKLFD